MAAAPTDATSEETSINAVVPVAGKPCSSEPKAAPSLKSPPVATNPAAADTGAVANAETVVLPTYKTSQESRHYKVAKTLMKEGDLDGAMTTVMEGMDLILAALPAGTGDHHESLGPFHYLYGSSLLYQIEESSDPNEQMTQATDAAAPEGEEEAPVEDLQIAWENLESARCILGGLLKKDPESKELKMDLALVYMRVADLQKLNSNYEESISDYTLSLKLHEETEPTKWSRKIAGLHYSLGLLLFNYVAVLSSKKEAGETTVSDDVLATKRSSGFQHLYLCGKTFAGIISGMVDTDPDTLIQEAEKNVPNFKSTGEGEDEDCPKIISLKVKCMREHIAGLEVKENLKMEVSSLVSILDEIQETVDESEAAEQGMQEVSAMKEQITAAVAAEVDEGESPSVFGSAAAAISTATAQPLMVKKKKKRATADDATSEPGEPIAKKPKSDA